MCDLIRLEMGSLIFVAPHGGTESAIQSSLEDIFVSEFEDGTAEQGSDAEQLQRGTGQKLHDSEARSRAQRLQTGIRLRSKERIPLRR